MKTTTQAGRTGPNRSRTTRRFLAGLVALATVPATLTVAGAASAGASTLNGVATISNPAGTVPLASGGSATSFTVVLPANAACTGDTATGGYHVFSYFVPQGTNPTSINFSTSVPSTGFGLVDNTGSYYGAKNTAITTGQITGIPTNFQWAPLVTNSVYAVSDLTANSWETGIACADVHGVVSDYWNTQISFTASNSDPNGFVWSAGPPAVTPEVPYTLALPVLAVGIIGGAVWFRRRRSPLQSGSAPSAV